MHVCSFEHVGWLGINNASMCVFVIEFFNVFILHLAESINQKADVGLERINRCTKALHMVIG